MRIEQTIYTTEKIPDTASYYDDLPKDPIHVLTFSDEQKLTWLQWALTGNRYSYLMTITDE